MASLIEVEDADRVRTITLNRPERLNALNSSVLAALSVEIRSGAEDPRVRCFVIRGAGERAFSAGADLEEIRGIDVGQAHAFIRRGHDTINAIERSPVPVLAEVDGFALGGGLELMLACHVIIASDRSQFGLPEARIGCIPGFGGTQRLPRTLGKAAAFHLMLTGERIDAARAWATGLLSVPPVAAAELRSETERTARLIASGSRTGLANLLEAGRQATAGPALEHEAALAALSIASADGQEGITSFAERREPSFTEE
ncbi:enoyl-CoA hydratase/isomerase family protein [Streptomyces luomodiensis]|uniref:Enoyl-CoA hydratase/isomerase family protein n=1 Tax=Streptomyces luomodiensis TaxID=3026192 RepID=A0ABY9V635_9ACTN|nr:enoyl-CoA hydratase/isomerase family protein [Streptomyces sp. SCA4-21]WNF00342.1 enoyl-CoA hydratase/isomerase family protein [Streptomyces sp. SCA4-21]